MIDATMAARVACPRCGRRARVTARELDERLGFCATCDARFALDEPEDAGDGPTRALVVVGVHVLAERPHSAHLIVRRDDALEVELRTARSVAVPAIGLAAALALATLAGIGLAAPVAALVGVAIALATLSWRHRSQRVRIEPGRLTLLDAPNVPIVRLAAGVDLRELEDGGLAVDGTEIGAGLALSATDTAWLRDAIRDALR